MWAVRVADSARSWGAPWIDRHAGKDIQVEGWRRTGFPLDSVWLTSSLFVLTERLGLFVPQHDSADPERAFQNMGKVRNKDESF